MCADVMSGVSVDLSESTLAYAAAKAVDLHMTFDEYVGFALDLCGQLPNQMLFALSVGIPVDFRATATLGGEYDG